MLFARRRKIQKRDWEDWSEFAAVALAIRDQAVTSDTRPKPPPLSPTGFVCFGPKGKGGSDVENNSLSLIFVWLGEHTHTST